MKKESVVVAMSGGVDSAVTALILLEQGYDVVGVNIRTYDYESFACDPQKKSCCSPKDIQDARDVGLKLDIPFYVLRMEKVFEDHVIKRFITDYSSGRTPNPCVECNTFVKFGSLFDKARSLGIDRIATGHYARIFQAPGGRAAIQDAVDTQKNQAYYLYGLEQQAIENTIFPLGGMTKPDVRNLARQFGLAVADKAESQEICFVPENDYRSFLTRRGVEFTPGFFKDTQGHILGKHSGREKFTVGQRKGLGIAWKEPLYVISIEETGDVILGTDKDRAMRTVEVEQVMFQALDPASFPDDFECRVQIRYRSKPAAARARYRGRSEETAWNGRPTGHRFEIEFLEEVYSIAPGQSAVIYPPAGAAPDNIVLAGGILSRA